MVVLEKEEGLREGEKGTSILYVEPHQQAHFSLFFYDTKEIEAVRKEKNGILCLTLISYTSGCLLVYTSP